MGESLKPQVTALLKLPGALLQADARGCVSYLLGRLLNYVSPGPFLMGSSSADPTANPDEQPQHTLPLAGYWIARHPVTVAQFKTFVQQSGHQPRAATCLRGEANWPVVNVTWEEALAYCRWLSQRSSLPVTLPSEAEWEKAARGREGRLYPWGDQPPTEAVCNFEQLMPVGAFSPQADSPYGCADMGNVWEWTRSLYRPYPYRPQDGRESLLSEEERVIRGVTFNERSARGAFRYHLKPDLPLPTLGFRVVVSFD
jgi:formylglycine-generating enzyme required for sulfatase activity